MFLKITLEVGGSQTGMQDMTPKTTVSYMSALISLKGVGLKIADLSSFKMIEICKTKNKEKVHKFYNLVNKGFPFDHHCIGQ